jgi:NADPH:quinone reductase-like Zn-dependent oxidoreductase
MKAVIFRRRGAPDVLSYEDVADPVPGPDEVLVRVGACGLNHLDLHVREGSNGMRAPLPHIGGLEPAGTIGAVGSAVTDWSLGDQVIVLAFAADARARSA